MSLANLRKKNRRLQSLLLKRFGMALASYALALLIFWVALLGDFFRASLTGVLVISALVLLSQVAFFALFRSGLNLRFDDSSLTEPQILVALAWHTYLLSYLDLGLGQ